jgi:hypothetical protein
MVYPQLSPSSMPEKVAEPAAGFSVIDYRLGCVFKPSVSS